MSEEEACSRARAVASALGITFYVVRGTDGQFSAVQQPTEGSEIIATIEPAAEQRSLDDLKGFGEMPQQD
jgi:hypothetical protein